MTLSEFLLARIAEDEHAAGCEAELIESRPRGMKPAHMAFTPARVLAECAAKRRIVEEHANHAAFEEEHDADDAGLVAQGLYDAMIALAVVYKDHPDYREDWTP